MGNTETTTDQPLRSRRRLLAVGVLLASYIATVAVTLPPSPDANIGGGALLLLTAALTWLAGAAVVLSAFRAARRRQSTVRCVWAALLAVLGVVAVVVPVEATDWPMGYRLVMFGVATAFTVAAVLVVPGRRNPR